MGLFDLPAPLFDLADGLMDVLPAAARLAVWAAAGAALSMFLYRAISPQRRIAALSAEAAALRRSLNHHDGEFADAWPLIRSNLGVAGRRLALVTPPAIVASLPLIAIIVWIAGAYGHYFPEAPGPVPARAEPAGDAEARVERSGAVPRLVVRSGSAVTELPLVQPVPVVHKRYWWNFLFGNPAGYLPGKSPVERVYLELPRIEVLSFGPGWMRTWEATFFVLLVAFSLLIKQVARIE